VTGAGDDRSGFGAAAASEPRDTGAPHDADQRDGDRRAREPHTAARSGPGARALDELRARPRHLVLGALVAGMLVAPLAPRLVLLAAGAAAVLGGRRGLALAAAVAVLAGALGAQARLAALDRTVLPPLFGTTVEARVVLLEQPRPARFGATALAQLRASRPAAPPLAAAGASGSGAVAVASAPDPAGAAPAAGASRGAGERVLLRIGSRVAWPPAATGAIVALRGRLGPLSPFESYQRPRGAHAAISIAQAAPTGATRGGPWRLVDVVRARAESALEIGLPPAQAALLRGMALGEDEALDPATRADFRASGLSHLLAASGENVALLAALALPLLAWLGLGLRGRQLGVLALIALYVPLAGGGPSIQRAGVMGAATTVAALAGRPASRWYALLLAAAATLALNPRASADPGWQLSFAAVVAIALLAPGLRRRLRVRRVPPRLAEAAAVSAAATLGTAPLIALHFSQLSLVSLPANLLAAPAVAPIMWLGMLAAAVGQLAPALALPLNVCNAFLLGYVGWVAHAAAGLPHANVRVGPGGPAALAAVYAAIAFVTGVARTFARRLPRLP
jgi:competence protein ComEC